jgi:polyprenyl P-hydroxybenzoate/phenylacrylic acid decarboxylase-like protein
MIMGKKRLIVALTGASGIDYAVDFLKALKEKGFETHLVLSPWAERLIGEETGFKVEEVKSLADFVHDVNDMASSIASSSFLVEAMVVIPCTVKTASEIASANCSNLISRAADNMLKTKRKLIVCVRETPLSPPALKNLYDISLYGGIVFPLSPGFYHRPKGLKDLNAFITGKLLDLLAVENESFKRWE